MKAEFIKQGRFKHHTIWITGFQKEITEVYYSDSDSAALNIGNALQLWAHLTTALVDAGQKGTLATLIKEVKVGC